MQLNKKLGALLIGSAMACIPFMSKAAPLNAGDFFFFAGHEYLVIPNGPENEFPKTAEDVREETAEDYAQTVYGFANPSLDLEELPAPFDAGISLLLGAGAIAGLKKA